MPLVDHGVEPIRSCSRRADSRARGPNHDGTMALPARSAARGVRGLAAAARCPCVAVARAPASASPRTPATVAPVSFRNHVIPVLTKAGCNSGACHGAAAGKNGFSADAARLRPGRRLRHDHAAGRRPPRQQARAGQEPAAAEADRDRARTWAASGSRPGSPAYDVLARWIASGMPAPSRRRSAVRLARGHARRSRRSSPAHVTPLRVTRDASPTARPRTSRAVVAVRVGRRDRRAGRRPRAGHHQGPGRDGGQRELPDRRRADARPVAVSDAGARRRSFASAARHNRIDDLVLDKLRQLQHSRRRAWPADAVFIRRAFLDAAGILPTRAEVEAFRRRHRRPTSARRSSIACCSGRSSWTTGPTSGRTCCSCRAASLGRNNVRDVLRLDSRDVAANTPWDRFVYELTTASGTHRRERRRQLLPDPPQPDRDRRELHAGVSRPDADLRALPQPPDGEVDADRLLRVREPLRAGRGEGRRRRRPPRATRRRSVSTPDGDILHPRLGVPMPPRPLDGVPMASARAARIAAPMSRAG